VVDVIDIVQSDLNSGDEFLFTGISPRSDLVIIKLVAVSTTGMLTYTIVINGDEESQLTAEIPYDRALLLIKQGIWMDPGRPIARMAIEKHRKGE
jgi:hypothetical protein